MNKLIKKGQLGTPLYKEIHLQKDPVEEQQPTIHNSTLWMPELYPKARMDGTVQQLTNGLSTYKPTPEQIIANTGIKHKMNWYDWIPAAITAAPFVATATVTAPEWGPAALTTVSTPTFWAELLKDTGTYIVSDIAAEKLTGKGIGAHVNNIIGLEEDHPVGEFIGFGGTGTLRRSVQKAGKKALNFIKSTLQPSNTPSQIISESVQSPQITKVVQENGKIRLRLSSHTDNAPREIVIVPQGNSQYYVHVRTWNDPKRKIAANLTQDEIQSLLNALYDEIPIGGEILVPQTTVNEPGTRGTLAAFYRLMRDPRFEQGHNIGTIWYPSKNQDYVPNFKVLWSQVKKLPPDYQRQVIERAYNRVMEYLGSEEHIQQIMNSGVSREYATTIANELKANASLIDLDKIKINDLFDAYRGKYSRNMHPTLTGPLDPKIEVGIMEKISEEQDAFNAILHELGGHASTLGSLMPANKFTMYLGLGTDFETFVQTLKNAFPHIEEVSAHNEALRPIVKKEVEDAIRQNKIIKTSNGESFKPSEKYLEYLQGMDEYSARARAYNMGSTDELDEMSQYFTPESIERLKKLVWGISIPLSYPVITSQSQKN